MRHPLTNHSWHSRIASPVFCAAIFVLSVSAFAQESAVPAPPPDAQPATQPSQLPTPDASNVRAVRLSDVEGKVQVFNGANPAFDQAQPNMPAVEGMRFVTGEDGRLEIQFEDGSVARITPDSSVTLAQLHRNGDGTTVTTIDANSGLSYYELNGRSGQYTIRFGPNSVTPMDSSIFRINLDGNPADLAVTHGTVHVSDGQNLSLDVRTNHSIHFDIRNPGQYNLVQSVAADTWDQWNSDRDQALATLEENATTARAGTGNPDDAAWNDLDYYGDWYDVPGYGMAWSPSGVGTSWDPFAVGYWGYYPTFGYTWISGYSWGWWPYHCGAWNWFGNFGWMWFPGNCGFGSVGFGWYPYSTVWHCPPNYKPPVRPKIYPGHGLPAHGVMPHPEPLIAVNRGPQFSQQFRTIGGSKPAPRTFDSDGRSITPAESTVHVRTGGPLGEGFTTAAVRTHPEVFDQNPAHGITTGRTVYQPGRASYGNTVALPPPSYGYRPAPVPGNNSRSSYSPPSGVHYSPPPPPPAASGGGAHVSAPASSGGGAHPH